MATYAHIPLVLWDDERGNVTAAIADDWDNRSACAPTEKEAIRQIKDYLAWHCREYGFVSEPEFEDAAVTEVRVSVRPEYVENERVFPCNETFDLRVPCIHWREESGMRMCAIPTLDIRFNFHETDVFKDMVAHFVRNVLKGRPPEVLVRCLSPANVRLRDLAFRIPDERSPRARAWFEREEFEALRQVAEPFGTRRGKRAQIATAFRREEQVRRLLGHLRHDKANTLLVGEAGSGKSTVLVETVGTVLAMDSGGVDKDLRQFRFWRTNAARLIAGMAYLGQWEERCERIVEELEQISGWLCFENLLDLVRVGGQGPGDSIAAFILPWLQRRELHVVAEATPRELDACRRLLPGFADAFQILRLPEFSDEEAQSVLSEVVHVRAGQFRIEAPEELPARVRRLFRRFMPYRAFPGPAVGFIGDLFDRTVREEQDQVGVDRAIALFTERTGLPEEFLRDEVPLEFETVRRGFEEEIIGQPIACEAAAHLVTRFKSGMNDPSRPLGVQLYCGPTGVGKTALARALARRFFGAGKDPEADEPAEGDRLVRLDMSEYSAPGAAERLLRAPDGGPSDFIKRIRRQPFAVVLLDEIEKAAPEVFDVFMNVFDEGRLTDRLGRLTTFRSAVLVMTSNLGAEQTGSLGFGTFQSADFEAEAMSFFRPEFFNRIDRIVSFQRLDEPFVRAIAEKELRDFGAREGLARAGLKLEWNEEVVDLLVRSGFDARLGARPLQRTIEEKVVTPLAMTLAEQPDLKESTARLTAVGEDVVVSLE